jgi:hypothetical protein
LAFGVDVPLQRLLGQSATIGQLASLIDSLMAASKSDSSMSPSVSQTNSGTPSVMASIVLPPPTASSNVTPTPLPDRTPVSSLSPTEAFNVELLEAKTMAASVNSSDHRAEPVPENVPLPLSFNQKSLFFLSELDPSGWSSRAYNIPFACQFLTPVSSLHVRQALILLMQRHTALRTLYKESEDGNSHQIVRPSTAESCDSLLEWQEKSSDSLAGILNLVFSIELGFLLLIEKIRWFSFCFDFYSDEGFSGASGSDADVENAIRGWMLKETYRLMDLKHGPTMRATIVTTPKGKQYFLWVVHHISVDLWSMVLLLDDLRHLMHGLHGWPKDLPLPQLSQLNGPCRLDAPRMQYYNIVDEQGKQLQPGPSSEALWSFWQRSLAEPLPVLQLPTDRPRPPIQTYQGAAWNLHIPRVRKNCRFIYFKQTK